MTGEYFKSALNLLIFSFFCVFCLHVCMYVITCMPGLTEARRGHGSPGTEVT